MQLFSMEVTQLGTADRTQVGLLGSGLNAICGRKGSGKSSLLRWLGGMLQPASAVPANDLHRSPANELMQASGRMTLRVGPVEIQLERTQRAGSPACKLLRRITNVWHGSPDPSLNGMAEAGALSSLQRDAFDRLAAIPSDWHATERLWALAKHWDLDQPSSSPYAAERAALLAREQQVLQQLQSLEGFGSSRESLLDRRRQLETERERLGRDNLGRRYAIDHDEHRRLKDRLAALDRDAQQARLEISEIDAALARLGDGLGTTINGLSSEVPASYRQRLQSLDAQVARWRGTLAEIMSDRQRLEASATDAHLEGQLGEQFAATTQINPRLALRALEAQLLDARRHFEALLDGVDRYQASHQETRFELPQTLRLMHRELHEVCQQLSRYESQGISQAKRQQILQLTRCESEMRQAIERLIAERSDLLREIATACRMTVDQVSVAYSDSCRCADHPQLDAWLSAMDPQAALSVPGVSSHLIAGLSQDEVARLDSRRQRAVARLDACQRDSRELESRLQRLGEGSTTVQDFSATESDIQRELDGINEQLQRLEQCERLRVELSDIRRRLQQLPIALEEGNSLRGRYYRHLAGLTGQSLETVRRLEVNPILPVEPQANYQGFVENPPRYATYDRQSMPACYPELALRLAIVEVLAAQRHPIPVCLDQTLDGRDGPQRLLAVRYLAGYAEQNQLQVCLLTDDQTLIESVKAVRGNIVPIVVSQALQLSNDRPARDINRQLLAYANEWEADKWEEPEAIVRRTRGSAPKAPWMLTERSDIEQVPSIGPAYGNRLRALGIERVRDLLQADPHWVADDARLAAVDSELVGAWQSEARLLCGMPQLRPFDARVLAGAGVRDQRELASMHPSRLLERVEQFLTTERGRHILRSGSRYELSRITAWIASAKTGRPSRFARSVDRRPVTDVSKSIQVEQFSPEDRSGRRSAGRSTRREAEARYSVVQKDGPSERRAATESADSQKATQEQAATSRTKKKDQARRSQASPRSGEGSASKKPHADRFYLEIGSPVVDAPSVGDTMAKELAQQSILTVEQLLAADAEQLASALHHSGVTAGKVKDWQDQARLMCRTPNLRGHDAQILVACGITSPESLARMDAANLLEQVDAFVASKHGQRILRGSPAPDLDEIHDWIRWAGACRAIMAA